MTIQATTVLVSLASLDRLVQGERAAVATYEELQGHLPGPPIDDLDVNRLCHGARVDALLHRITALGGSSAAIGNAWLSVDKNSDQARRCLGRDALINALESGEDHIMRRYRRPMTELDPTSYRLVAEELLPAQERTQRRVAGIKRLNDFLDADIA